MENAIREQVRTMMLLHQLRHPLELAVLVPFPNCSQATPPLDDSFQSVAFYLWHFSGLALK